MLQGRTILLLICRLFSQISSKVSIRFVQLMCYRFYIMVNIINIIKLHYIMSYTVYNSRKDIYCVGINN